MRDDEGEELVAIAQVRYSLVKEAKVKKMFEQINKHF